MSETRTLSQRRYLTFCTSNERWARDVPCFGSPDCQRTEPNRSFRSSDTLPCSQSLLGAPYILAGLGAERAPTDRRAEILDVRCGTGLAGAALSKEHKTR